TARLHSENSSPPRMRHQRGCARCNRMTETFPPRGSGEAGRHEKPPSGVWGHPQDLSPRWDWVPGKVLLGEDENGRLIGDPDRDGMPGRGDDRHVVTEAGSRAGKSTTVLIPNLKRYPGSVLV